MNWGDVGLLALGSMFGGTVTWVTGNWQRSQERKDSSDDRDEARQEHKQDTNEQRDHAAGLRAQNRTDDAAERAEQDSVDEGRRINEKLDEFLERLVDQLEIVVAQVEASGNWEVVSFRRAHRLTAEVMSLSVTVEPNVSKTSLDWLFAVNPVLSGRQVGPEERNRIVVYLYSAVLGWKMARNAGQKPKLQTLNPFDFRPTVAMGMSTDSLQVPDGVDFTPRPGHVELTLRRKLTVTMSGAPDRVFGSDESDFEWGAITGLDGTLGVYRTVNFLPTIQEVIPADEWSESLG